jgi:hypothetical protein
MYECMYMCVCVKAGMMVNTCNPSTWEAEVGDHKFQGAQLPCLKNKTKQKSIVFF